MLTIEKLTISYSKKIIIRNLSVEFKSAQIHGFVGLNGAGKTSLLNTIYGYKKQKSGTILYNEVPLKRKDVAFLETENIFYSNITGREYLSLFSRNTNDYNADDWNMIFKIPLDELTDGYSTGMKKKLALMAILKQNKKIIILDEPFNGLDIEASKILTMIIERLREKQHIVIITSHILESLTSICDFIHYIDNKTIKFTRDKKNFSNIEVDIFEKLITEHSRIIEKIV